jgi:hypothetical protein
VKKLSGLFGALALVGVISALAAGTAVAAAPTPLYYTLGGYQLYRAGTTTVSTTFNVPHVACGSTVTAVAPGEFAEVSSQFGGGELQYGADIKMECVGGNLSVQPAIWISGHETTFSNSVQALDQINVTIASSPSGTTVTLKDLTAPRTFTLTQSGLEGYANQEYLGANSVIIGSDRAPAPTMSPVAFTGSLVDGKALASISPRTTLAYDLGCITQLIPTTISQQHGFLVEIPPVNVTSFTPTTQLAGATLTIDGSGFNSKSKVVFQGNQAAKSITFVSSSEIRTTVPLAADTGPIVVTNTSAPIGTITTPCPLNVLPVIAQFTPITGPTGKAVTINGGGFHAVQSVTFGSMPAVFTVGSATQIKATVPNGDATAAPIVVNTIWGTASSGPRVFTPTLAITGFTPTSGPVLTNVTINGIGFNSKSKAKFNGKAATTHFVSSTQLTALVPVGATRGPITVTNSTAPTGTVSSAASFG